MSSTYYSTKPICCQLRLTLIGNSSRERLHACMVPAACLDRRRDNPKAVGVVSRLAVREALNTSVIYLLDNIHRK